MKFYPGVWIDDGVRVIEQHKDLLDIRESLYVRRPHVTHEKKDLSYFNFIAQNESRKGVVGLCGCPDVDKSLLVEILGDRSIIRGTKNVSMTRTSYEKKRETTIHIHSSIVFISGEDGISRILTMLNTSGHMDFISETIGIIHEVDIAVVILDIQSDLFLWYELILKSIKAMEKPLIMLFKGMDGFNDEQTRSTMVGKIKYLKESVMNILNPDGFFVTSSDFSKVVGMDEPTCELLDIFERCSGISTEFVAKLLSQSIFDYRHISKDVSYNPRVFRDRYSDSIVGFLPVEDLILCSFVTDCVLNTGALISVADDELHVEEIYLPFPGCLVKSESVQSNIGVLVRLRKNPLSSNTLRRYINVSPLLRDIIKAKGGIRDVIPGEFDPCVRVSVKPEVEEEFNESIGKMALIYRGLRMDKWILSGYGELFMDAVIHDLREVFNIKFDVLNVFSCLKEDFIGHFEEKINLEEQSLIVKGRAAEFNERRKNESELENILMEIGPLVGEPIINGCIEVGSPMESIDLQNRVSDVLLKHTILIEPFYAVEVIYMPDAEELVTEMIDNSRGVVFHRSCTPYGTLRRIIAYIPVVECFGFETDPRVYSCSLADCSKIFSHMEYLTEENKSNEFMSLLEVY